MDDLNFGQKPITPVEEAWHNAQRRKQYDIIRICNPTDKDFYVEYDTNQHQRVPALCTIDVPRHIAFRYIHHMKDSIINDMAQKMHDEFITERRLKGLPDYKDKAAENAETYETASYPKTNDEKLMAEIIGKLWVGIVAEYGRDILPPEVSTSTGVDQTPTVDRILESFSNRRVDISDKQTMYAPVSTPSPTYQPTATPPVAPQQPAGGSSFSRLNETLTKRITPEDVTL